MEPNCLVQPFLKWAGGKRQLLAQIRSFVPREYGRYFEPFVGAGALLFDLQPRCAVINDANNELINCYLAVRDYPGELIEELRRHVLSKEHYYALRAWDRKPDYCSRSCVERAARIIFLNKTCFNGLFRVNSQGQFNVPFGNYRNPRIANPAVIQAVSAYLNQAEISIISADFSLAVESAREGDFVYFDPPYDPLSSTASFTGYSLGSFDRTKQTQLKELCDALTERGCRVLISNSATDFIRSLYSGRDYQVQEVSATRAINSVGSLRGKISELLILNTALRQAIEDYSK